MKLPFVSRERLEDVQRQLLESEAERKRLLDLLLNGTAKPEPIKPAEHTEHNTSEENSSLIPFTTPFDRLEKRVSQALKDGKVPQQFRAKAVR